MNTCGGGKGWSAIRRATAGRSSGALDVEQLVEARIPENVEDVMADVDQAQAAAGSHQALVRAQQDAEPGAGDVFEAGQVDFAGIRERVEEGLRPGALRG